MTIKAIYQLFLLFLFSLLTAETDSSDNINTVSPNEGEIEQALKMVGLNGLIGSGLKTNLKYNVSTRTLDNNISEFMGDAFNGKSIWQVEFDSVKFSLDSIPVSSDIKSSKYMKIVILVDSVSGQPLEVKAKDIDRSEYIRKDYADSWPYQFDGTDIYRGIPKTNPRLSFLEAIKKYEIAAMASKEIIGINVLISFPYMDNEAQSVWVITMMGGPTWRSPSGGLYRDRKYLINADNGELLPVISRGYKAEPNDSISE